MIYFDNAATTMPCDEALSAAAALMRDDYGNPSSPHGMGRAAAKALFDARRDIAKLIGADTREVYFTSCGSEANTQALFTAAAIGERLGRRHIVSDAIEHHSVLNALKALEARGFEVTLLPPDGEGVVSPDKIQAAARPDTALVTVMSANNEIGTLLPIKEIAALCRERGVLFHTDAVQAAGHVPIDVGELGCDMLSISGHKFHGIKGAGALYVRQKLTPAPIIFGGGQERGKRGGTENLPAIRAMAAALAHCAERMDERSARTARLRDRLIEGLSQIPRSLLNGSRSARLPGNVSFCFDGVDGEQLLLLLDARGICASAGAACTTGRTQPSHVLTAIGRTPSQAKSAIRLTLSEYNTPAEVEAVIAAMREIIGKLRRERR